MRSVYALVSVARVGFVLSAILWTPLARAAAPEGGSGAADASALRTPTHVACVGDSITAGFGAQTKGYVSDLIDMFGSKVKVGGFGHSGACMISNCSQPTEPYQGLQEYKDVTTFVANAGAGAVVDVIIMLGTNDAAPQNWPAGGNAARFTKDYGDMLDHFVSLGTHPVIYMVLPPAAFPNDSARSTNLQTGVIPAIQQLAQARKMPLIDVNTPTLNHPEWSADGLHPNDAGHLVIAKTMYAAILELPIPTPEPEHDAGGSGGASGNGGGGTSNHADGGGTSGHGGSGGTSTSGGSGGSGGAASSGASGGAMAGPASSSGGDGAGDSTTVSDSESEASQDGGCSVAQTPSTRSVGAFGWLLAALGYVAIRRRRVI